MTYREPPARIEDCTVDEYLFWCDFAIRRGAPIPAWKTKPQYLIGLATYPGRVHLLSPAEHAEMGLPSNFGRVEPLRPEWQESFLCTLATDPQFAAAVRSVLLGGPA